MIQLLTIAIDERTTPSDLERIRRNLVEVARELQSRPYADVIKRDLVLADGVPTPVPHGLGRRATAWTTNVRGAVAAGWIEEIRDGSHDPNRFVVLQANSFGASVTVDVCALR